MTNEEFKNKLFGEIAKISKLEKTWSARNIVLTYGQSMFAHLYPYCEVHKLDFYDEVRKSMVAIFGVDCERQNLISYFSEVRKSMK